MRTALLRLRLADAFHPWYDIACASLSQELVVGDSFSLRGSSGLLKRGRHQDPLVVARNVVIDRNPKLTCLAMARRLDLELGAGARDGSALGLPEKWVKSGITSYKKAYNDKRCRSCLASMISKRRRVSALP